MVTNQHTGSLRAIPGPVCLGVPQTHSKSLLLNLAKTLDSPGKVLGIHLHVCLCLMHLTDSNLLCHRCPSCHPAFTRKGSQHAGPDGGSSLWLQDGCGDRPAVGLSRGEGPGSDPAFPWESEFVLQALRSPQLASGSSALSPILLPIPRG